jgi:hypothetical protein
LRHQCDKTAVDRNVCKVGNLETLVANVRLERSDLGVRPIEKFFEEPKLLHDLHRGRMHRIAAKIAQKIRMLLQDHRLYARARK